MITSNLSFTSGSMSYDQTHVLQFDFSFTKNYFLVSKMFIPGYQLLTPPDAYGSTPFLVIRILTVSSREYMAAI
jgi:hypothetical protein